MDEHGRCNAAPFSFFNCLSADPPILATGVKNNADMSFKDTGHNVRMTEVFTVNIVSHAIAEAMHVCGAKFPKGVDELKEAGLTAMKGEKVASPWIGEAPAFRDADAQVDIVMLAAGAVVILKCLRTFFGLGRTKEPEAPLGLRCNGPMKLYHYSLARECHPSEPPRNSEARRICDG